MSSSATSSSAANALVLSGSAALLGGALAFQYLGGLAPCEMCLWQRWPHIAALVLGLAAWALGRRRLVALAALAVLASAAIGGFHAGVEYHWWAGPQACTGAAFDPTDIAAALRSPMIRCDAAAWTLFGVSMAGYNALISTLIGATALWLLTRRPPKPSTR